MNNLYIVATPIGNLQDITFRAIETLKNAGLIVCEDTRITSRLLLKYEVKKPLLALNEFNEEQMIYSIIENLKAHDVALVSDAGTPLISDPGFRLVEKVRQLGGRVIPIPGPSAFIAALSSSGLPTDKVIFLGFLSKNHGKAAKNLESVKQLNATVVLYESPHRVVASLSLIQELFGDINVTIARELTKIHEEIFTDAISGLLKLYKTKTPKGEFVILFSTK
jgi:16S rRNA (cytidine1402-2'-O)-methyltransferase